MSAQVKRALITSDVYPRGDTYYHVAVGTIGCATISRSGNGYVVVGCRTTHPTLQSAARAGIARRAARLRLEAASLETALTIPFDPRSE